VAGVVYAKGVFIQEGTMRGSGGIIGIIITIILIIIVLRLLGLF